MVRLRSHKVSPQHQSREILPALSGFLWTSSNAAGTRPETAIPAIPPPVKPAKHPRTLVNAACHDTVIAAPCDQRRIQPFPRVRRTVVPALPTAAAARNVNKTRGGIGVEVSIPPSACIPPPAICFTRPAPVRGVGQNGAGNDTTKTGGGT